MRVTPFLLLLLLAPFAASQSLSADHPTLYPHYGDGRWQNTITPDPAATQSSSGSNPLGVPLGLAGGSVFEFSWSYPMQEALASDLALDADGTVDVELHVVYYLTYGATAPTPASVDVSWKLHDGSLTIAEGSAKNVAPLGETSPAVVQWSVAPALDVIPAGTTPTLTVYAEGPAANYWMETEDPEKSRTTLPIYIEPTAEPVLPQTHFATVDGAILDVNQTHEVASIDTYVYNWTQGPDRTNLTYSVAAESGNTTIVVVDGNGTELLNETIGATTSEQLSLEPTAPGSWHVTLRHDAFVGNASVAISALPADVSGTPSSSSEPTTGATTTSATTNEPEEEAPDNASTPADEESPSLAVGIVLVGLVFMARRRR